MHRDALHHPNDRPKDAAGFTALGTALNKAGAQVKKAGLQFCYHNHAFEFTPLADGKRALDVLLAAADPELLKLELDVFWVSITGADPVSLINEYKGRVALMHLKDKMKGAPVPTESVPPTTFVEVAGAYSSSSGAQAPASALLRRAGSDAGRSWNCRYQYENPVVQMEVGSRK
jgi:sugar phosphate isomerase/epimerase